MGCVNQNLRQNQAYTCSSKGAQLDREPSSQPRTIIAVPAQRTNLSDWIPGAVMQHKQMSEQRKKCQAWATPTCHLHPGPLQQG